MANGKKTEAPLTLWLVSVKIRPEAPWWIQAFYTRKDARNYKRWMIQDFTSWITKGPFRYEFKK